MGRRGTAVLAVCCALTVAVACGGPQPVGPAPEQLTVQVISTRPHDPSSFTEGLEIDGGQLYESTGLDGHSLIRRSDATSGATQAMVRLPNDLFGEGVTLAGDGPGTPPKQRSHQGYEWLYVLDGRLRLMLGEHDLVLTPGEVAEFDTHTPHCFANAVDRPTELLMLTGPQGQRAHVRARPKRNT